MSVAEYTFESFSASLISQRWRGLVLLAGDDKWADALLQHASEVGALQGILCIDDSGLHGVLAKDVSQYLGNEYTSVIYNLHAGLDPDALCIAAGFIKAGGCLFLLAPKLTAWKHFNDPALSRLMSYSSTRSDVSPRAYFLERFASHLRQSEAVYAFDENTLAADTFISMLNSIVAHKNEPVCVSHVAMQGQQALVDAVVKVAGGRTNRPLVVTANRGRGKSAALGMAAVTLLQNKALRIAVTAMHKRHTLTLFKHVNEALFLSGGSTHAVQYGDADIKFYALDELLLNHVECDLLLVDEAAAIPIFQLKRLLQRYKRCVFATTINGYEGTGKAFEQRFLSLLISDYPQFKKLELTVPIRWNTGDPLETFFDRLMLFTSDIVCLQGSTLDKAALRLEQLSAAQLFEDELLLADVYALLNHAHYRTSPRDLRQLLDVPNMCVFVLWHKATVLAVACVQLEGELDHDLGVQICEGKRRVQGHMLSQNLMMQTDNPHIGTLRSARVMRIAVHPDCQRQTIGSYFIKALRKNLLQKSVDYWGSCFGATDELIAFWANNGFSTMRLAYKKQQSSGEYTLTVAESLSGPHEFIDDLNAAFYRQLLTQMAFQARDALNLLPALLETKPKDVQALKSSVQDDLQLQRFVADELSFDYVVFELTVFFESVLLLKPQKFSREEIMALTALFWRRDSWQEVASILEIKGRSAVINRIKKLIKICM